MAEESLALRGRLLGEIENASGMGPVALRPRRVNADDIDIAVDVESSILLASNPSAMAMKAPLETSELMSSGLSSGAVIRLSGVAARSKLRVWAVMAAALLLVAWAAYAIGAKTSPTTVVTAEPTVAPIQPPLPAPIPSAVTSPVDSAGVQSPPGAQTRAEANGTASSPRGSAPVGKPASAAARSTPEVMTSPARPVRAPAATPKTATPASAGADHCKPNYTFDADGNKHFKPECFGE
jgi:hypothetical protein